MMLFGEANREAPVRTEPHPTRSFALPRRGSCGQTALPSSFKQPADRFPAVVHRAWES
jgi:hypothetical protein